MKVTDKICGKMVIQLITNISLRTGYYMIDQAKMALKKESHQVLTVGEFIKYYGLSEDLLN